MLVSDGESNCGDDPCDVAKDLVSKGFDVTIHTVGFRVSTNGRAELSCLASASGGRYVDVDSSDELNRTLQDLTRAKLRVQATSQSNLLGVFEGRISVTLSNQSAVTASDVQLLLKLEGETPTHVNTLLRVGNLLPGTSVFRSWDIGGTFNPLAATPSRPADGTASRKFTVDSWAKNADRVSVQGVLGGQRSDSGRRLIKDDLGDLLRKPVDAGHPIVILGDSYSAGEGTFDYVTPPEGVSKGCHRSDEAYLIPVLASGDVVNLACSGAVSWDYYYSGRDGTPAQLEQLADLKRAPGAVVMTLGGNDIGFADIVRQCVERSCDSDPRQITAWKTAADSLRTWLKPVYQDVWQTINLPNRRDQRAGAYAPVIVLAYPQVTHATKYGACGRVLGVRDTFSAGEVKVANELSAHLNAAIKAAVADARDAGYEIYFLPDTADAMLPNHTLCDGSEAYVNNVLPIPAGNWPPIDAKPESIHPNVSGYAAITGKIFAWASTVAPEAPDTSPLGPKATEVTVEPWSVWTFDPAVVDFAGQGTVDGSLFNNSPLLVNGSGYAPGTPVIIMIHSTPAVLGTLVADKTGSIRSQVRLPPSLALGRHEVVASGTNSDGTFREDIVAVAVLAQPPLWTQAGLLGAGGLLLLTLAFTGLWWRPRRKTWRVGAPAVR